MDKWQFPVDPCSSMFEQEVGAACLPWQSSPRGPLVGLLKKNGPPEKKNDPENGAESTAKKIEAMLEKLLQNQARQEHEINCKLEILKQMLDEEVQKLAGLEKTLQEDRNQWKGYIQNLKLELTRLVQQKEMQDLKLTAQTLDQKSKAKAAKKNKKSPKLKPEQKEIQLTAQTLAQKGKEKATKKSKKSSKVKQEQKEIQLTAQTLGQKGKEKATKKSKKSSKVKQEQKVQIPANITKKLPSTKDKQPVKKKKPKAPKVLNAAVSQPDISQLYKVSQTGPSHCPVFKAVVDIKGKTFTGTGPSKKSAKAAALAAVLKSTAQEQIPKETPDEQKKGKRRKMKNAKNKKEQKITIVDPHDTLTMPPGKNFEDRIASLIMMKFSKLTQNQPQENSRIMLAGIVMTTGQNVDNARVICVATGTKCISGGNVSICGEAVNDCHAEIISRRCLLDFIYSQLEAYSKGSTNTNSSIFVMTSTENGQLQFTLKDNIKFHLFIKSAPCGDARIFCHGADLTLPDNGSNRSTRGQLRTKIESGEGTIAVKPDDNIQTWDAILAGQRLLTMSCSDKIAKWNVLGVQGTLLSQFITPLYFDSITVGGLHHPEHMHRAVVGRISEHLQGLPYPYKLNKPQLCCTSTNENRQPVSAPKTSLNWTVGQKSPEIINTATGKTNDKSVSRLAKQSFFARYLKLSKNLSSGNNVLTSDLKLYSDFKKASLSYNMAKEELKLAFIRAELGSWVSMPQEQGQFEVHTPIPC